VSKGFYRSESSANHPIHWNWMEEYPVQDPDFEFKQSTIDLMASVLSESRRPSGG
jgi:hypothetical protein